MSIYGFNIETPAWMAAQEQTAEQLQARLRGLLDEVVPAGHPYQRAAHALSLMEVELSAAEFAATASALLFAARSGSEVVEENLADAEAADEGYLKESHVRRTRRTRTEMEYLARPAQKIASVRHPAPVE